MILVGDVLEKLKELPDGCVQCCVTSPPYWGLRDYGADGQIGLERTPEEYVQKLVDVFREVRRVLRDDGTCWLNLGDSYAGSGKGQFADGEHDPKKAKTDGMKLDSGNVPMGLKPKDLVGIPWRVAFALQADGWWLRQDIIWHKPNVMPESVVDRCTKGHEYIFLLTKSAQYFFDNEAIKEKQITPLDTKASQSFCAPGGKAEIEYGVKGSGDKWVPQGFRNKRSVWEINTNPFRGAHFATFPEELPEICIKAGTSEKGCCEKCGSPYERVTECERDRVASIGEQPYSNASIGQPQQDVCGGFPILRMKTVGWQPSCKCGAGVKPCVVLDPFFGSGTTGVVARKLKCDWIGIELNPEYADIAEKRLAGFKNWFILKDIKDGKQRQLELGR